MLCKSGWGYMGLECHACRYIRTCCADAAKVGARNVHMVEVWGTLIRQERQARGSECSKEHRHP